MKIDTITNATNTHIQLLSVTIVVAGIRSEDISPAMDVLYGVDPYTRSTHKTIEYNYKDGLYADVMDLTATLVLSIQDGKFMEKYRQAMFKLRLQYPNVYVRNTH